MMSFLGTSLASVLVKIPFRDPTTDVPQTPVLPVADRLPRLFGTTIHSGILIAIAAVVLVHLVMTRTAFGLKLRIVGANPRAAAHAGLNVAKLTFATFALSAGLAGLAGAVEILGVQGTVARRLESGLWAARRAARLPRSVSRRRRHRLHAVLCRSYDRRRKCLAAGRRAATFCAFAGRHAALVPRFGRLPRSSPPPADESLAMSALLTEAFLSTLIFGAVTAGVPLLLAGLGEQISEKAGILNIGIEGMMLAGAYGGFVAAYAWDSFSLGFLAGAVAGMAVASLMAIFCVRLSLNQIVVGIALTLAAEGMTALLHFFQFSRTYPRLPKAPVLAIPGLDSIPVIGPGLFRHNPVVYLAVFLVAAVAWLFRNTYVGLNLEAAGSKPAALDAAGIDVVATRTGAVLTTGALAGLGGAYMAEVGAGLFVPYMTNGAGFIAIVLAMFARGRPLWVLLGALLFGASLSLTTALQVAGIDIPTDVVQMLPFAMVILVLVIFGRGSMLPPALGLPYIRGER